MSALGKTVIIEIADGCMTEISGKKPAAFADSHRAGGCDIFQRDPGGIILLDKACHASDYG